MKLNKNLQIRQTLLIALLFLGGMATAHAETKPSAAPGINCDDLKNRKGIWANLPAGKFHLDTPEWKDLLSSLPDADQSDSAESRRVLDLVLKCFEKTSGGKELKAALDQKKEIFASSMPKTLAPTGSLVWKNTLDDLLSSKRNGDQNFFADDQSHLKLRLNAAELQTDVIRIVRSAQKILSISYLEYYQDRFGLIFATELIAKKLNRQMPDPDLFQELWGFSLTDAGISISPSGIYQTKTWESALPKVDWKKIDKNVKQIIESKGLTKSPNVGPKITMFLDRMRVVTPGNVNPRRLLGVLKKFGIPVALIKNFHPNKVLKELLAPFQMILPLSGTNHVKITANESEASLSGGNIVDKVIFESADSESPLMKWHDAAVQVQGPLVTDIHRFFALHYNNAAGRGQEKLKISEVLGLMEQKTQTADGFSRLISTVNKNPLPIANHGFTPSQTEHSLEFAIQNAKESIFIENAFFSDVWVTSLLVRKAQEWKLDQLKAARGENPKVSTCGTDLSSIGRKKIVILVPKDMDQPPVRMAEMSLIGFLTQSGVDVCRWSSDIANKRMLAAPKNLPRFLPKTMMHSKVWQVDGTVGYVGSANMNRRSIRGDLELGVLSSSKSFNDDLYERLFKQDFKDSEVPQMGPQDFLLLPAALFLNGINAT